MAPSALIAHNTKVYVFDGFDDAEAILIPVEEPKAMTRTDIENTIIDFVQGAKNAIEAGFDGVEIHGANGYLIDEFLRSNTNNRDDEYGGNQQNRIRFLMELTQAVAEAIGKDKTGIRLSPFIKHKDMEDPEILDTILLAAKELNKLDIVYIHLCEADWDDAPKVPNKFRKMLRSTFHNTIIATGNKTPEEGEHLLQENLVDLVGFGRNFISNPDYPLRVKNNFPLTGIKETHTIFGGGGAKGYTDYTNATEYSGE
jgi:N-ethylmaleimide reductase